jgi:hypothetical protein
LSSSTVAENINQVNTKRRTENNTTKEEIINLQIKIDLQTRDRKMSMESEKGNQTAQIEGLERSSTKSHQEINVKSIKIYAK